jgi:DNA-binding MarR family transcriptional regulator
LIIMDETSITAHDLSLLEGIEQDPDVNQSMLANQLGIAVGTVNWHLKRLIEKGAIKVKRASRKKLRYIITPEGIALRARLAVDFVQQSFSLYRLIRTRAAELIPTIKEARYHQVRLDVVGDMADVIRLTCLEHGITVVEDENTPRIRMEGLKVYVDYPEQADK